VQRGQDDLTQVTVKCGASGSLNRDVVNKAKLVLGRSDSRTAGLRALKHGGVVITTKRC
jgi:hypothetical protein